MLVAPGWVLAYPPEFPVDPVRNPVIFARRRRRRKRSDSPQATPWKKNSTGICERPWRKTHADVQGADTAPPCRSTLPRPPRTPRARPAPRAIITRAIAAPSKRRHRPFDHGNAPPSPLEPKSLSPPARLSPSQGRGHRPRLRTKSCRGGRGAGEGGSARTRGEHQENGGAAEGGQGRAMRFGRQ